jgi:hypothetical protein
MSAAAVNLGDFSFQVSAPFDEFLEKVRVTHHRLQHHRRVTLVGKLWRLLTAAL